MGIKRIISTLLIVLGLAMGAQAQPLVQAGNHKSIGSFTLPQPFGAQNGPSALAIDGQFIYAGCTGWAAIAKFTLPTTMGGVATLVQDCTPLPNIDKVHPTDRNVHLGGITIYKGKIVASVFVYYDGGYAAVASHYIGDSLSTMQGPVTLTTSAVGNAQPTNRPGMVGGYMSLVPPDWEAKLGGPVLTGQCCIPIIGRSSFGPSVSVFNPAHMDGRPLVGSTMLIGYPIEHKTLGEWDANPPGPYYGGSDQLGSAVLPSGTSSILFTGRHGPQFCYGPGTADKTKVGTIDPAVSKFPFCYDPLDAYQGNHGPPYAPTMWAYNANDVLAVIAGTKKPWDVFPYAKWLIPGMPVDNVTNLLRAGTYDQSTRRYYVASTDNHRVWVSEIDIANAPPPPVDCVKGTPRMIDETTDNQCVNSVKTFVQNWTRDGDVAATNGGAACVPAIPYQLTRTESCDMPPPPPVPVTVFSAVKTCRVTVQHSPPDTLGGWGVQFRYNSSNFGSRDATPPYERSRDFAAGTYQLWGQWTKTGQPTVTIPQLTYVCQ